ncbi:hypothetical protein PLESTB_000774400 [Pleodorina starrii]|uniref:DUF1826 domain-containing protein n=1 Tax=Pleodorina starrii TaxID=330485 RepID=A0A9W6F282_9CHLO|nr:hypothetical protein PLESTM_000430900 [Pleodorina starrii]GLC53667.1 hypothetical protein PLESTB_000774400 [Pleodorina starrii]GLC70182.1 hypothetical protein PLESTF_000935000 [Pleodorina starrii]
MGLAQLQHWARAQYMHDRVRVSTARPADLLLPDVNIVHLKRCSPVHPKHLRRQAEELGVGFRSRVVAKTEEPGTAAAELTRRLSVREVQQWLQEDISELIRVFGQQLGYPEVSAKLEVLGGTPCPRFHADHVGVRLLVSYYGQGTVYVENRHARRMWLWGGDGGVAVAAADAAAARQAGPGDLLFLKGHAAPGNYGMGAVHRSPDLNLDPDPDIGESLQPPPLRLLLTIDDVVGWAEAAAAAAGAGGQGCGCGRPHGALGEMEEEGEDAGAGAHRPDASVLQC